MAVTHGLETQSRTRPSLILLVGSLLAVVGGIFLRLQGDRIGLWLDEAQSVAIASLAPRDLLDALKADGHPPLYYFVLHYWMDYVGTDDGSLRLLSAVFGIATLVPAYVVGRRLNGSVAGILSVAVIATSPFLIRFSTEVRMYSLVTLLSLLWFVAVARAEERPTKVRLITVAILVALLVLTHYWAMFLFGAYVLLAVLGRRRGQPTARLLAAHAVGGLAFVPWLPYFLYQMQHTGTPWAKAQDPASVVVTTLADLAGGREEGSALGLLALLFFFGVVGFAGRATRSGLLELDLTGRATMRPFAGLIAVTMVLAIGAMTITSSAFAGRYIAIIAGLMLVLVAVGISEVSPPILQVAGVALFVGLGLAAGWVAVDTTRSQGQQVAAAIAVDLEPGDIVVVCPDQIGPATARYLPNGTDAVSYPLLLDAGRVDWVDYADRHAAASPAQVADQLVERADGHRIWLVWQEGYLTLEGQCETLRYELSTRVPGREVISPDPAVFEPMWLSVFEPTAG